MTASRFRKVAIGGTFQSLHMGHRYLIERAFQLGEEVVIGLASDYLVRLGRKPHIIDDYETRRSSLVAFLQCKYLLARARIVPLDEPYGPPAWDEEIEAIVVSEETEPTAWAINRERAKKGLKPMEIVVVCWVLAEDGLPISTSRVMNGEIDPEGRLLRSFR